MQLVSSYPPSVAEGEDVVSVGVGGLRELSEMTHLSFAEPCGLLMQGVGLYNHLL